MPAKGVPCRAFLVPCGCPNIETAAKISTNGLVLHGSSDSAFAA